MTSLLTSLLDNFVCWIKTGCIEALNFVIAALGDLIAGLMVLLPDMPDPPTLPSPLQDGLDWVGYWFPIDYFLSLLAAMMAFWVAWWIIRIPLRWAKANPS